MKLQNPVTYQTPNEELLLYFPLWQGTPNIICLTMAKTLQNITCLTMAKTLQLFRPTK